MAIESAGVTLVGGDLRGVAAAGTLSRKTMSNIRQNLFFAVFYYALGVCRSGASLSDVRRASQPYDRSSGDEF